MTQMTSVRPSVLAAGALAVAAPWQVGQLLFAAPPSARQPTSLRGAVGEMGVAPASGSPAGAAVSSTSLALFGASAAAAVGLGATRRRGAVAKTVAAAEGEGAAPAKPAPRVFSPAAQLGAMAPLGYFDPLGFCSEGDQDGFRILRMAELKHGRVAMMASVGLLGQHFLKFPGFEKIPAGIGVLNSLLGQIGLFAIFAWSGVLENFWQDNPRREAGNFGDPFGIGMYDNETREKEISNGRFAMICVTGILAAEIVTGKDAVQQFGF
mmetsp:Transcript_115903/g.247667  ORF Transcript_115903/g.247667 Transcript_115903/m.247667 type:complete len:266 (+) Transcript_115903:76-873(+)